MIPLSNGHELENVTASGSLGFRGKGWWWEWLLVWLGFIDPKLFTNFIRTLTFEPRLYPVSNLSWIRPWTWLPFSPRSCVRLLPNGGAANKVGLYNPGYEWWCKEVGPKLDFKKVKLAASIFGTEEHLVIMTKRLNGFDFVAIEVNVSCPNTDHATQTATIIRSVKAVKAMTNLPVIVKVSVDQDYLAIAEGLKGIAEAISLNSVPWKLAFPDGTESPLAKIGKEGTGGGGVSGKPAQMLNWAAVFKLSCLGALPVIAPSIMEYDDVARAYDLGAKAVSFGAIHLRTPWKPTSIVKERNYRETLGVA
ncbi:MAG: hypothetical protein V4486_03345 [Patescibacteria group bacterium]